MLTRKCQPQRIRDNIVKEKEAQPQQEAGESGRGERKTKHTDPWRHSLGHLSFVQLLLAPLRLDPPVESLAGGHTLLLLLVRPRLGPLRHVCPALSSLASCSSPHPLRSLRCSHPICEAIG